MKVRRVVTGHDANGKAVFVSDEEVDGFRPTLTPESEYHLLWGGDEAPHFPDDGSRPATDRYFPPVGGFRFGFFAVPPGDRRDAAPPGDLEGALAEFEANLPGLPGYMEPDAPGMHTTDTIDFEVVLEGEIWLELDDGVDITVWDASAESRYMVLPARPAGTDGLDEQALADLVTRDGLLGVAAV